MSIRILSVNPGSTSTKIAVYDDEQPIFSKNVPHPVAELEACPTVTDQYEMRKRYVEAALAEAGIPLDSLDAVVGRGGLLPPVQGGGYAVNDAMLDELRGGGIRPHASNLGAIIADAVARPLGIPAYIYDAVSADEFAPVAKITGIPEISRQSFCHVLNQKAVARRVAESLGKKYEDCNFIVAHIGGGISIGAHRHGRIVDAISDDAGPFSPERAGSVPLNYIINMCYSGKYTKDELREKLRRNSGIKGHLGTNDCVEVEHRIAAGDAYAAAVYEAQAYQIAKGIGEMAPVLCGDIDAVIVTGGLAHADYITGELKRMVGYLSPVVVVPGEVEMEALSLGALRILRGEEAAHTYGAER